MGNRRQRSAAEGTFLESVVQRLQRLEVIITDLHWHAVGQWQKIEQTILPDSLDATGHTSYEGIWEPMVLFSSNLHPDAEAFEPSQLLQMNDKNAKTPPKQLRRGKLESKQMLIINSCTGPRAARNLYEKAPPRRWNCSRRRQQCYSDTFGPGFLDALTLPPSHPQLQRSWKMQARMERVAKKVPTRQGTLQSGVHLWRVSARDLRSRLCQLRRRQRVTTGRWAR